MLDQIALQKEEHIVYRDERYLTIKLEGTIIEYPVVTVNEAKGDFAVPVIYRLNERPEPITVENGKAIQMTLDWKDIN